jgi:hypothetical protein
VPTNVPTVTPLPATSTPSPTPTSTPTPTDTPTPTPTDTPIPVTATPTPSPTPATYVDISNQFFAGIIGSIIIGGQSLPGVSFPIEIGNGASAYITLTGNQTINVQVSDVTLDSCVTISTATGQYSQTVAGGGSVVTTLDITGGVSIYCTDSAC